MGVDEDIKRHYQNDVVAEAYDDERFRSVAGRVFDRLEKRALMRAVGRVQGHVPDPRTLDVPCGTGRITEALLQRRIRVLGGDISPAMIAVARSKCEAYPSLLGFQQLDLDRMDVPPASFDLVTCIRLLHHLDADARRGVLRALATASARFVIVNYSISTPWHRVRRRLKRLLGQGVSRTSAGPDQIQEEAHAAGLVVESRSWVLPLVSEDVVVVMRKSSG